MFFVQRQGDLPLSYLSMLPYKRTTEKDILRAEVPEVVQNEQK